MSEREALLGRVREALGRNPGQAPAVAPPARVIVPERDAEARIESLLAKVAALAGKTFRASGPEGARDYVARIIEGRTAVASHAPFLAECGVTTLGNVRSGVTDREELRALCATCDVGITSANYALADTGSLVLFAGAEEARLISLLPPVHIALVPRGRVLTGLDELFTVAPLPAERSSSMVLITGPSRTADIEQILVRGVHGPGEIHVVVV